MAEEKKTPAGFVDEKELALILLIDRGQAHNAIYMAAGNLLGYHPLAWYERPLLFAVRWWCGRRLAQVLAAVPADKRNEILEAAPEVHRVSA